MGNEVSLENPPKVGYHVLQVHPNSPGERAGLISFFDFIVSADGVFFEKEDSKFVDILKSKLNQPVKLLVYNTREEKTRETQLIPTDSWGGNGLAGISIRFCSFEHAHEHVWHVLEVYPNSPASVAGLQPRTDYIVGTPELLFNDSEDFFTLISFNEGKPIPLYVYSVLTDEVRLVTISPNSKWGGSGSLGCDVGYGILHRIPVPNIAKPQGAFPTVPLVTPPGHIQTQQSQPPPFLPTQTSPTQQQRQIERVGSPTSQHTPPSPPAIPTGESSQFSSNNFEELNAPQDWNAQDMMRHIQQIESFTPTLPGTQQKFGSVETGYNTQTSPKSIPRQLSPQQQSSEDLQEIKL